MTDFYLYGKKLELRNIFYISNISSGSLLPKVIGSVSDTIYTATFLDGRQIPIHETNFKMCRKLTEQEKLELL